MQPPLRFCAFWVAIFEQHIWLECENIWISNVFYNSQPDPDQDPTNGGYTLIYAED